MEFNELCEAILKELPEELSSKLKARIDSIAYTSLFRAPDLMRESWKELSDLLKSHVDLEEEYDKNIQRHWGDAVLTAEKRAKSMYNKRSAH